MNTKFYFENSYKASKLITKAYSTSFSLATALLEKEKRDAIYAVYGFVRLVDEIVDSFHNHDKLFLLNNIEEQLDYAFKYGISTNVILNAFVDTVKRYNISSEYIQAFMESMRADLTQSVYTTNLELEHYIYGSADVVGLICLQIFCDGDEKLFKKLAPPAQKLGSAFQKVNFLRDLHCDRECLGRSYFPEVSNNNFNYETKKMIEKSINDDFNEAWQGVRGLPGRAKLAVALAYYYYRGLFEKIKHTAPEKLLEERVRICDMTKYCLFCKVMFLYKTNRI